MFFVPGGNRVHHTQILCPENDRCVGPEVLFRPRYNRSVYCHLLCSQTHCDKILLVLNLSFNLDYW